MSLTQDPIYFHVVFVVKPEGFCIGGIFSDPKDADRYSKEWMDRPESLGVAPVDKMTMEQIKDELGRERLGELADVLRPLIASK